jgi:hypothetical protein
MGCFIKTARLLSSCGTEHNREFLPLRQSEKTALCIRCTPEEANVIRMAAKNEHRTVGGFVVNAALEYIVQQKQIEQKANGRLPPRQAG